MADGDFFFLTVTIMEVSGGLQWAFPARGTRQIPPAPSIAKPFGCLAIKASTNAS